ncbi:glutamate racemase [Algimonas arctica]|uniref:Glutamate racemase n=1 Tax=Algimonas arctica TaxID=1479486 RepID=A0A8J3CPF0_9PROT|nr:glutamate racemase [Algimonas arctica]GHA89980.1 glutamate racemase [Algimonas arctica]
MTLSRPNFAPHALVFDSGVGGLSVSRDMRTRMPDLRQTYLADDAFRPYGEKTEAQLRARLPALLAPLCDMLRPDIVVIACNTASTTALPAIRAVLDVPVVGVVPAIKPAAAASRMRRIAVLGTPGTVRRRYVDDLIDRYASDCEVRLKGSLALVEQAERKLRGDPVDRDVIAAEIAPLFQGAPIDAVVLACTHFPLLRDELVAAAPYSVDWIDSGDAIARRVESLLAEGPAPKADPPAQQIAYSTGLNITPAQRLTFSAYGFTQCIALKGAPK